MKIALRNVLIFLLIFLIWGSYRIYKDFSADPGNTQAWFYNTAYGMSKTSKEALDLFAFVAPVLVGVFVASLGKQNSSKAQHFVSSTVALFFVSVFSFFIFGWLVSVIGSGNFAHAYRTNYEDANPIGIFVISFYATILFSIISSDFFWKLFRRNKSV